MDELMKKNILSLRPLLEQAHHLLALLYEHPDLMIARIASQIDEDFGDIYVTIDNLAAQCEGQSTI